MDIFWYILPGMAGQPIKRTVRPIHRIIRVYQETLYYFLRILMGEFWYILLGWSGKAIQCQSKGPDVPNSQSKRCTMDSA